MLQLYLSGFEVARLPETWVIIHCIDKFYTPLLSRGRARQVAHIIDSIVESGSRRVAIGPRSVQRVYSVCDPDRSHTTWLRQVQRVG
jgi:hypothetical protein